jgi:signal transduction histidine kinase
MTFAFLTLKKHKKKTNELKKSKELSDNLLRILCHDINNPLAIIKYSSEQLQNHQKETHSRNTLRIKKASDDIQRITQTVASWMTYNDNKITLQQQQVSVDEIIEHLELTFEEKLNDKQIKLNFLVNDPQLILLGDKSALFYQVFNNLVSNAIKFSFENSVINMTFSAEQEFICVKIRDFGIGIKQEMLHKIFSPFEITTSVGTKNELGIGFGLPIVANVIEKMKGKITVENASSTNPLEKGTLVSLLLPRFI